MLWLKNVKKNIKYRQSIKRAYMHDCHEYILWQYNNPKVKTRNALEARILRQTHIVEKGMSLSCPKEKFGVQKANELIRYIEEFSEYGYSIDSSTPVINAIGVLKAYICFHKERGFFPESVIKKIDSIKTTLREEDCCYGRASLSKTEMEQDVHGEFPQFICSRHSVRQFSDVKVNMEDIKKALSLARYAPSACNRQPCKAYIYQDENVNYELGRLIPGNTGFEDEVQNYIVVTGDLSAFYDDFERNQVYVDGGIFTMAVVEALHYYGIASCILQNSEYIEQNKKIRKVCGNIPENEKIILFIAIGYYKEPITYAVSKRKKIDDILIVK